MIQYTVIKTSAKALHPRKIADPLIIGNKKKLIQYLTKYTIIVILYSIRKSIR